MRDSGVTGTPLTDYERELLVILMEECAEVTQAAAKLIRFGRENSGIPNTTELGGEIGDVETVVRLVLEAGLVSRGSIAQGVMRKYERLARFMQTRV